MASKRLNIMMNEQGMWKYFDKDGNVIFTKHYVNGHIVAEGLGPKK